MVVPTICAMIIVYFLIYGLRGMQAKTNLLDEISVLEQQYGLVRERKRGLESHVELLQPNRVNPDFLDEKSREMLGLMHKDEIVIIENK